MSGETRAPAAPQGSAQEADLLALAVDGSFTCDAEGRLLALAASPDLAWLDWPCGTALWSLPGADPHDASRLRERFDRGAEVRRQVLRVRRGGVPQAVEVSSTACAGDARSARRGVLRDVSPASAEVDALRRYRDILQQSGDPMYVVDRATMRFVEVNERACRHAGYSRDDMLAMEPHVLLRTDRETLAREYDEAIACSPRALRLERPARDRTGASHIVELTRRAVRQPGGWLVVTVGRDVTQRRQAQHAAHRLRRQYAALSAGLEAMLASRHAGEVDQRVCEAAVQVAGFVAAAVIVPDEDGRTGRLAAGAGRGLDHLRSATIRLDEASPLGRGLVGTAFRSGHPAISNDFAADQRLAPWRDQQIAHGVASGAAVPLVRMGRPVGVLLLYAEEPGSFDDDAVSLLRQLARGLVHALERFEVHAQRQQMIDELRLGEERYRGILRNMTDGYFEVDLSGRYTELNPALRRILGREDESLIGMHYREYIAHEAADRVKALFGRTFESGEPAMGEWPVRRADGEVRILENTFQLVRDAQGRAVGFRGVSRDVTARRQAEEALRRSEARYRSIIESIEEAYYELDLSGRVTAGNAAYAALFGRPLEEVIGMHYKQYVPLDKQAHVFESFHRVYKSGQPGKGVDWPVVAADGTMRVTEGSIHLILDEAGQAVGFRGIVRDVTARRQTEERFRHVASHDVLTGLKNRAAIHELLTAAALRAQRYGERFSLLFIDLDGFKAINDAHGHDAGDELLREVAQRLQRGVRSSDVAARLGGDEFLVLLHGAASRSPVQSIANALRESLQQPVALAGGRVVQVSSSIGVACCPDDGADAEALLRAADAAMYRAKHAGRNRIEFSQRSA